MVQSFLTFRCSWASRLPKINQSLQLAAGVEEHLTLFFVLGRSRATSAIDYQSALLFCLDCQRIAYCLCFCQIETTIVESSFCELTSTATSPGPKLSIAPSLRRSCIACSSYLLSHLLLFQLLSLSPRQHSRPSKQVAKRREAGVKL